MLRSLTYIGRVLMGVLIGWAMWVAASEPMVGRPFGQPALVASLPEPVVSAHSGDGQAQGARL